MRIDLARTITALTAALDLVGIDEVHHGKRVALMAGALAAELGWDAARAHDLTLAGMLLDCGVSRSREHKQLTATLEWAGASLHCERGERYLLDCPPLARFAPVVRWHHTRFEELARAPIDPRTREEANLAFFADRLDVLLAPFFAGRTLREEILWQNPAIVDRMASLAPALFDPAFADALRRAAAREAFWLAMDPAYIEDELAARLRGGRATELDARDALAVAGLFARVVDAKSSYTLDHSTRVARIARHLAGASGFAGEDLDRVEIAALLHDVGKLHVPEEIIDKPGSLTPEERALVRRHSYDTERILSKAFPGEPIAEWAGKHHENLLGTGYPNRTDGASIPAAARVIAVADIFQAMSQARPYRARLALGAVLGQLDELVALGRIDADVVTLLRAHADRCYQLAVDPES